MRRGRPKTKKKKKNSHNLLVLITGSIIFFAVVFAGGIFLFLQNYHQALSFAKEVTQPLPTPTVIPTPTIDMSLQNTNKTYTNQLYGFTVNYPALGEDIHGNIISCGNNIEEPTVTNTPPAGELPVVHIDSLYQISIQPWGSQLSDYLNQQDKSIITSGSVQWIQVPNVDEAVIFYTTPTSGQKPSYFDDVFALYKKGDLIFQVEKTHGYTAGCQMVFSPKDATQTPLIQNQSALFQSLLYNQYKSWNEALSIQFIK